MSVSHVAGSALYVIGASTVQCLAVLRSNQCAKGRLVYWVEWLKGSSSASGVAVLVSAVNVWTLSVVPVAFNYATHQVCWWHVSVNVGASGGLSRIIHSVTLGPSVFRLCCPAGLLSCTRWCTRSGVKVSSVSCILSLRGVGRPTSNRPKRPWWPPGCWPLG